MKKSIVAIGISFMLVGATCFAQSKTKQQVIDSYKKAIVSIMRHYNFTRTTPFSDREMQGIKLQKSACGETAADVIEFVNNHNKNLLGMKDTLLLNTAKELGALTIEAVSVAINIRNELITEKKTPAAIHDKINKINNVENKIQNVYEKITKESFTISEKKESKEVLVTTLSTLLGLTKQVRSEAMRTKSEE